MSIQVVKRLSLGELWIRCVTWFLEVTASALPSSFPSSNKYEDPDSMHDLRRNECDI